MKVTQAQVTAMRDQIMFLLEDSYKAYNEEVLKRHKEIYQAAANKVPDVRDYVSLQGQGRSYNPQENEFKKYLHSKFPEDFRNLPTQKSIEQTREAIGREIVIVAPECKTTEEILAKVTQKYVV